MNASCRVVGWTGTRRLGFLGRCSGQDRVLVLAGGYSIEECRSLVKTILDNFCVKSGIFCSRCEEKLKNGKITDLDVKMIRTLTELEKENPALQDVTFHKAVEAGDMMALMVDRRGMDTFLSSGARLAKTLGDRIGRRVKVLGFGGDERDFLEELFTPFAILTINTIWLPDGSRETKVILTGRKPRRSPVDFEVVKKLARELKGLTLRVEFED